MTSISRETTTWKETEKKIGQRYGIDDIAKVVTNLLVSARAESTNERVRSQQQRFVTFVEEIEKIEVSDVTFNHFVRFVSFLAIEGKNKSARPFIAPVRAWFESNRKIFWTKDDEIEIQNLMDGYDRLIESRNPQKVRTALPPDAAVKILEWGERKFMVVKEEQEIRKTRSFKDEDKDQNESTNKLKVRMEELRDVLVVLLGYQFCLRASSLMSLTGKALVFKNQYLTVKCVRLKGKSNEEVKKLTPRQIPTHSAPCAKRIVALLQKYLSLAEDCFDVIDLSTEIFVFDEEIDIKPSKLATDCLKRMLKRIDYEIGDLEKFTSHSLRKGAASAAFAIGAKTKTIEWLGNWAPDTPTVMERYVTDEPRYREKGAKEFFGWLLQEL